MGREKNIARQLYTPGIGVKFWFVETNNISGFLNVQYLKPIFTGGTDITDNGL